MINRSSFAGALVTMAIGAVLAFAVRNSPSFLDLRTAGLILVLGAAGDLLIRFLIADSPLLGPETADVAAVLEPIGDPVLDPAGNPVVVPNPAASPASGVQVPLVQPPTGTVPAPVIPGSGSVPPERLADTLVAGDDPYQTRPSQTPVPPAPPMPPGSPVSSTASPVSSESPVALTTLTGRPVKPRTDAVAEQRRRWRREARRSRG